MKEHAAEEAEKMLAEHVFFRDLDPAIIKMLSSSARSVSFDAGEPIYREGNEADRFFLIETGRVAIQVFVTGRGSVTVYTVGPGDILGWSWFYSPYRRRFDATALEKTRAVVLEGAFLRERAEEDPRLGYELLKRFSLVAVNRLQDMTLQLLDLYGRHL
mgnify:CR=1 FL=1